MIKLSSKAYGIQPDIKKGKQKKLYSYPDKTTIRVGSELKGRIKNIVKDLEVIENRDDVTQEEAVSFAIRFYESGKRAAEKKEDTTKVAE